MFEINLLGPFEVFSQGKRMPMSKTKGARDRLTDSARRLLAFLALHKGAEIGRRYIEELFWPDKEVDSASEVVQDRAEVGHTYLSEELTVLKQWLGGEDNTVIVATRDAIRTNPDQVCLDVAIFDSIVKTARAAVGAPVVDANAIEKSLTRAIDLVRGQMLQGWNDDWVVMQRTAFEIDYFWALATLGELANRAEKPGDAIGYYRLRLAADPCSDEACVRLMSALGEYGDFNKIKEVYRDFCTRLRREFGPMGQPSQKTVDTYERLVRESSLPPVPISVNARRGSLPEPPSSFIGRTRELQEVKGYLTSCRLLSLIGPGGAGKTRLAIAAASAAQNNRLNGVWFIPLGNVADPVLLPNAIANILNIKEEKNRPITNTLMQTLKRLHLLLILDNCEHILEACARFARNVIDTCPSVNILVTSRHPLGMPDEHIFDVEPLGLVPRLRSGQTVNCDDAVKYDAVKLFVARAAAAAGSFRLNEHNVEAVVELCRRLDGLPLAIELVAARTRTLPVQEILRRFDQIQFAEGADRSAPGRQQSMELTIEWSYNLLTAEEQALFNCLAVFRGGWPLEAAEAVYATLRSTSNGSAAVPDVSILLSELVLASLVGRKDRATSRYQFLETVRAYAFERLKSSGETEAALQVHLDYYLRVAEQASPQLFGPHQQIWLDLLEADNDNLLAALDACHILRNPGSEEMRLTGSLWKYWKTRGQLDEGRRRTETALQRGDPADSNIRARALDGAAALAWSQNDYQSSERLAHEALDMARRLGNQEQEAWSLCRLGLNALSRANQNAVAHFHAARSIFVDLAVEAGINSCDVNLGILATMRDDFVEARMRFETALRDTLVPGERANCLANLSRLAHIMRDLDSATALIKQALTIYFQIFEPVSICRCCNHLAEFAYLAHDFARAAALWSGADAQFERMGVQRDPDIELETVRGAVTVLEGPERIAASEARTATLPTLVAFALSGEPTLTAYLSNGVVAD